MVPEPCPAGTYRNETQGRDINDCFTCPPGNYCPLNGSTFYIPCSNGSFCFNGTAQPRPCAAGFYCPEAKLQLPCPPGFYCPERSERAIPCPKGHYCEGGDTCNVTRAGTVVPKICPAGIFLSLSVRFSYLLAVLCLDCCKTTYVPPHLVYFF